MHFIKPGRKIRMTKINQLLTGKINGKQVINSATVKKQILAVATAIQILKEYPRKRTYIKEWEKYKSLRGVLLADEVGGGKTFEALSIISHAFLSIANSKQKKFRVLIIAAPAIRSKWEWRPDSDLEKYIEQTAIPKNKKQLLSSLFKTAQDNKTTQANNIVTSKKAWKNIKPNSNPRQGIWITSFGALPTTKGSSTQAMFKSDKDIKFPTEHFDYIIADEAHIVKSGYNDSDENISPTINRSAIRKIYAVQNENKKAKLLLLTATPFQNNLKEFIHMLSLVEDGKRGVGEKNRSVFEIIKSGLEILKKEIEELKTVTDITKERIHRLANSFDNEVGDLIGVENEEIKRPKEISTNGRKNGLDDFLRDVMIRNNKEPLDIISKGCDLSDEEKLQYLFFRDIITQKNEEEKEMYPVKLSQLVSSDEAFSNSLKDRKRKKYFTIKKLFKNKNLIFENKFQALIEIIDGKNLADDKKNVFVVFCRFIPTIEILQQRLNESYSSQNVFRLDGKTTNTKKRKELLEEVEKRNRETKNRIIFLVSQVGNEGLDFDGFSDTVIHFDGHYNPAVIDQRNGRIYRRGNLDRALTVKHLFLKETYDEKIKFIEQEKRKLKNFFLGDSGLEKILYKILSKEDIHEKKLLLKELEKIKFDFEPKEKYLLNKVKKILK